MKSEYFYQSIEEGKRFQLENKSWTGFDTIKYQKQIKDLVEYYEVKSILDYGCGKGSQYTEKLIYDEYLGPQTFDEFLGVEVYKYDPCVVEFEKLPDAGTKFDGVICSQVLGSVPHDDLNWVAGELESFTNKFCFIGINFQKMPKGKKHIYNPSYFSNKRNRDYFRSFFCNWKENNLFWWWKDRLHYKGWIEDQLNKRWKDIPDSWEGKYSFVEYI